GRGCVGDPKGGERRVGGRPGRLVRRGGAGGGGGERVERGSARAGSAEAGWAGARSRRGGRGKNGLRSDGAALWRAPRLLSPFSLRRAPGRGGHRRVSGARPDQARCPAPSRPDPETGARGRSDERLALLPGFLEVAEESAG